MTYINGYDHPHIISGAGTVGLEILEQVPDVEAVVIPVGGAGLIAGAALAIKALRPDVKVYGAEPEVLPSLTNALEADHPVDVAAKSATLADGLYVPKVSCSSFRSHTTCFGCLPSPDRNNKLFSFLCSRISLRFWTIR